MIKKNILFFMACALTATALAQQPASGNADTTRPAKSLHLGDKVRVTPYGFVRNYFTYDSRKTYSVIGGEYNVAPYDESWNGSQADCDAAGVERTDLNAVPDAKFLAITTRIGLNLDGPTLIGAKSSGKIEADFGGFSTTNSVLRIRHAYLQLRWQHPDGSSSELLAGQTWHPLSGNIMPEVLGMAAGAPFRPHSRSPQLRYILSLPNGFGLTAAALYQLQYMYNGPSYANGAWSSASSTDYANHAIVPELFLGIDYHSSALRLQIGADMQPLRPRTYGIDPASGLKVDVDELFVSFTPTVYFQYCKDKFSFKSRYLYAGNTSQVNQLNGYGVTAEASDGCWSYAPLHAHIAYADFAYGKKWRANLFFGYMKNTGADEPLLNVGTADVPNYLIFMKGGNSFTHLNDLWRVAPSISFNLPAINVGLEYEITAASFGDWDSNGSILQNDNLHSVMNHRVCLLVKYNF